MPPACFDPLGFIIREMYFRVKSTRCNVTQFIYFCDMLYMFQEVPPPIIRISKLYIEHRVLVKTCKSWNSVPSLA
jgi:hypothetical protein